jgi:hypothetical protein
MKSADKRIEGAGWMKVRSVAGGFLLVMGLPVALALADADSAAPQKATVGVVEHAQTFHIANSGLDVGPGSDEALLAMIPSR